MNHKPKQTTVENERLETQKHLCDTIIYRSARMMTENVGASLDVMLDRLLTFSAAQACSADGSAKTAAAFRLFADRIEAGLFHSITGENLDSGSKH